MKRSSFVVPRVGWTPLALALTLGAACGGELPIGSILVVSSVEVIPSQVSMLPNTTRSLVAAARTSSGIPVTGRKVDWVSTQPGVATVAGDGTVTGVTPGTTRITATVDGIEGEADVTVTTIPVDHVEVSPTTATVGVGATEQLTATVFDAGDNVLTGRLVEWTSSQDAVATVDDDGLVTGHSLGNATITATSEGKTATSVITVVAGAAAKLVLVTAPPATGVSGVPLDPAPQVRITDAQGNPVSQGGVQITASLASGTGTLSGAVETTTAGGVATFDALAITGLGTYTIAFDAQGLTGVTSAAIDITAAAQTLTFAVAPPGTATSGVALSPQPVVQLTVSGVAENKAGVIVTAAIASGPAGGGLTGTPTVSTNASGQAGFTNLGLTGPVGSYTLEFSAPGYGTITAVVDLQTGGVAAITITTQPSATAVNDEPFPQQPAVHVADGSGNPVSGVTVTVSIASGPAGATLGGTTTALTNGSGDAVFGNLEIVGPVGDYTLQFSAAGPSVVSGTISLAAGAATQLAITVQPTDVAVGSAISPAPKVELRDSGNNLIPTDGLSISVEISTGNGTLDPTSGPAITAAGVAEFPNIRFSAAGQGSGNHRLRFFVSSAPAIQGISNQFKVQ
ncbi:MAG TPA: Ig-like domain-containing protein [Gemmatimonadales bacterium]|nr:Ig-like domain-containing protein [Gemmatimonadales bacterium]